MQNEKRRRHPGRAVVLTGAALLIASGGGSTARAQAPDSRRPDIHFSFYTGTAMTLPSDLHIVQPTLRTDATYRDVEWRGRPFTGSVFYGVRVHTFLPKKPKIGFLVDFYHYKVYAKTEQTKQLGGTWLGQPVDGAEQMSDRVDRFQITNGVNLLTLGVLYREQWLRSPGFPEGRVQPYVGVGPSLQIMVPINTVNGQENDERRTYSGVGIHAQVGVRYGLTRRLGVFAEGKYTQGRARVNVADGPGRRDGGRATTGLRAWHGVAGLTYTF